MKCRSKTHFLRSLDDNIDNYKDNEISEMVKFMMVVMMMMMMMMMMKMMMMSFIKTITLLVFF